MSPRKSVVQSARQYDVTSRVGDFQNGEQSVHRKDEYNKNFEFITAILFRFLGSGDFESSQCYRKTDFGTFLE